MSGSEREGNETGAAERMAKKRRKLERIIAGRRREPMDYIVMGAVLLASVFALVEVLGGKEGASPTLVSGLVLAVAILATRQLSESAAVNRRYRALKEYLDLRLDKLESAERDGDLTGKSGVGERK